MWEKNLDPFYPAKRMPESDIKRLFWSKTTVLPTGGIITFEKLQWSGPGVSALSKKGGKKARLTVFYDISDLGTVTVCHPDWPNDLLPVDAYDENYQRNLTLEMHKLVQQRLRKEGKKFDFNSAKRARVNYILELRKAKGKTAQKRIARMEENGSLHSSAQPAPMKKPGAPALLPEVTLTEATPPSSVSTVKVRHE